MKEISSAANDRLKRFTALCRDRQEREKEGVCVIDGAKLCADACAAGHTIKELWLEERAAERFSEVLGEVMRTAEEVFLLKDKAADRLSELKAPQGVFAVTERPAAPQLCEVLKGNRVLVLCELQSPENAAAAVRTAAALNFDSVIVSGDCAELWSPRAIRAGAGAQMTIPIYETRSVADTIRMLRAEGIAPLAAALDDNAATIDETDKNRRLAVVIGNEGHGLSAEIIDACEGTVIIPMSGRVESLNANAASAILMWELRPQK